ncbi:MAG: hypothetical protein ACLTG4_07690 [Oscillospiraceae bacterium]
MLWIGTRIVLTLIFGAFYWPPRPSTMTVLQALWTVSLYLRGCAGVLRGLFFLTHGMLRKHLNLQ